MDPPLNLFYCFPRERSLQQVVNAVNSAARKGKLSGNDCCPRALPRKRLWS